MNCGMSMVKYILFIFNLLCALCGVLLIILGALLFTNIHSLSDLKNQLAAQSFPVALVVFGAAIFIIAFFGCCGAIRESECMSMTYAVLLFILLVLDIALIVLLLTTKDSQKEISRTIVEEVFKTTHEERSGMRIIEREWKCCGKTSSADYLLNVPSSCCPQNVNLCSVLSAYPKGCTQALTEWITKYAQIIAYVCLGVTAIELVGFIFACCLANHIRNHRRRSTY